MLKFVKSGRPHPAKNPVSADQAGHRGTRLTGRKTREGGDDGVKRLYVGRRADAAYDDEGPEADKDDDRFIREAAKTGKFISLKTFLRRFGR